MTEIPHRQDAIDAAPEAAPGAPAAFQLETTEPETVAGEQPAAPRPSAEATTAGPAETADAAGPDELEHGIASVFAALHAAGTLEGAVGGASEDDDTFDEAITFQLLDQLDRLWHRAA